MGLRLFLIRSKLFDLIAGLRQTFITNNNFFIGSERFGVEINLSKVKCYNDVQYQDFIDRGSKMMLRLGFFFFDE